MICSTVSAFASPTPLAPPTHLIRRNPIPQPSLDAVPRNDPRDKIREPASQGDKEVEHGNLERVRGVSVDFVVGLDDEEATLFVGVRGGDEGWSG